ncbi:hypothetical protein TTRE_0000252301 [Trichuris trichiura]|uniref:Uncharacterized protein n=1 Tax=Trichuris trichiura TaxID=36087 RepID=A0A077Z3L9_TRITR|nr:hypothetical protein TTRE_0000252301 [Trichuris trichiura]
MSKRYSKEFFMSVREAAFWKSSKIIDVCNNYFRKVETESKAKDRKPKVATPSLPTKAALSLRPMAAGDQWSGSNRIPASQSTINWQDGCRGSSYKTCQQELGKQAERAVVPASSRPTAYGRDVPDYSKQDDNASQKSTQQHSKATAIPKNGRSWQSRADQRKGGTKKAQHSEGHRLAAGDSARRKGGCALPTRQGTAAQREAPPSAAPTLTGRAASATAVATVSGMPSVNVYFL